MNEYYYPCRPKTISADSEFFQQIDRDSNWICEKKLNGWRMVVEKTAKGDIVLWTRHKTIIKDPLKEIRAQFKKMLPKETMLDGELIFTKRVKGVPDSAYMFDIIMLRGQLVVKFPLIERRRILERTVKETDKIKLSRWVEVGKKKLFEDIRKEDNDLVEGIVLKNLKSEYQISLSREIETPMWLKVKKTEKHLRTGPQPKVAG